MNWINWLGFVLLAVILVSTLLRSRGPGSARDQAAQARRIDPDYVEHPKPNYARLLTIIVAGTVLLILGLLFIPLD